MLSSFHGVNLDAAKRASKLHSSQTRIRDIAADG
jgi:hypothetical protein